MVQPRKLARTPNWTSSIILWQLLCAFVFFFSKWIKQGWVNKKKKKIQTDTLGIQDRTHVHAVESMNVVGSAECLFFVWCLSTAVFGLRSLSHTHQVEGRHTVAGLLTLSVGLKSCTFCGAPRQNHNPQLRFTFSYPNISISPFMFRIVRIFLEKSKNMILFGVHGGKALTQFLYNCCYIFISVFKIV